VGGEVRGDLAHTPGVAGGAIAAALAGELQAQETASFWSSEASRRGSFRGCRLARQVTIEDAHVAVRRGHILKVDTSVEAGRCPWGDEWHEYVFVAATSPTGS
jgi:hypothetical protein